jgi:hypothetical protein
MRAPEPLKQLTVRHSTRIARKTNAQRDIEAPTGSRVLLERHVPGVAWVG